MGDFVVVRPRDDKVAQQASDWCDDLIAELVANGHSKVDDVDDRSPADAATIGHALGASVELICYFGHGDESAWLTSGAATIDAGNVGAAAGKAVVSVACKTSAGLGSDAITAGVDCWLGFTIKVPVVSPHKTRDPFGDAMVDGLAVLGRHDSMQKARDTLYANFDQLKDDFDTGPLMAHPAAALGYFGAMALRDHVAVQGNASLRPLP